MNWVLLVGVFCALVFPVFVIGRRRGQQNPWAAFIPLLGVWIVLCESIGRSGWFSLVAFIPTVGPLILLLWTAVEIPGRHSRSRWWTLALVIPGVNVIGYWFYAFTLPRNVPSPA
jgi:uncharacterized membrane protein YhaH (DUF805 family)